MATVIRMVGVCPGCDRKIEPGAADGAAMWSVEKEAVVCRACGEAEKAKAA